MDLDLNQELLDPVHTSVVEFESTLESDHGHIHDRIRDLEAVTSRARQRLRWPPVHSPIQVTNFTGGEAATADAQDEGREKQEAEEGIVGSEKGNNKKGVHLIAKALGVETDAGKGKRRTGSLFDCNICLDIARDPVLKPPFRLFFENTLSLHFKKMLKVPDHQVAGHQAKDGILGPLIDDSGKFYKPLQSDDRGSNELIFYTSLSSDPRVPINILNFFPNFHGTKTVDASDGSGPHPHLVLEDLVSGYSNPSIIDLKIGSRTWFPGASEDYFNKCIKKDRETSTATLGFRISGLKVSSSSWNPSRKFLTNLSAQDVNLVLRRFVSSCPDADPDCAYASEVFGSVLKQLLELKKWFEVQTIFHFYSSSVLVVYEKYRNKNKARPLVKLVDFAHVLDGEGVIDHNFLGGLCSLIKFVSDIVDKHIE